MPLSAAQKKPQKAYSEVFTLAAPLPLNFIYGQVALRPKVALSLPFTMLHNVCVHNYQIVKV